MLLGVWLTDLIAFHDSRIVKVDKEIALHAGLMLDRARRRHRARHRGHRRSHAMTVLTAKARHSAPMQVRYADPRAGLPPEAD